MRLAPGQLTELSPTTLLYFTLLITGTSGQQNCNISVYPVGIFEFNNISIDGLPDSLMRATSDDDLVNFMTMAFSVDLNSSDTYEHNLKISCIVHSPKSQKFNSSSICLYVWKESSNSWECSNADLDLNEVDGNYIVTTNTTQSERTSYSMLLKPEDKTSDKSTESEMVDIIIIISVCTAVAAVCIGMVSVYFYMRKRRREELELFAIATSTIILTNEKKRIAMPTMDFNVPDEIIEVQIAGAGETRSKRSMSILHITEAYVHENQARQSKIKISNENN